MVESWGSSGGGGHVAGAWGGNGGLEEGGGGVDGGGGLGGEVEEFAEAADGGGGVACVVVVDEEVGGGDAVGEGVELFEPPGEAVGHVDAFAVVFAELFVDADEADVGEGSGGVDGEGVDAVVAGGPADLVVGEEVCGAFGFPGGVSEFDGEAEVGGEFLEEGLEVVEFKGLEGGGELDEDAAEFIGGAHGGEGAEEGAHGGDAEGDGCVVGDGFGGFDAEGEAGGDGVGPFLDAVWGGGGVEGGVEFEGIEGGGVGGEVVGGACAFGVEDALPVGVGEAHGTGVEVHEGSVKAKDKGRKTRGERGKCGGSGLAWGLGWGGGEILLGGYIFWGNLTLEGVGN